MRKVRSVSVDDRPPQVQAPARIDSGERLRSVIVRTLRENSEITSSGILPVRPSGSEGGVAHEFDFVAWVESCEHVAALAERVARDCAEAGMVLPRVLPGASRDRLSLDFGSGVLTIENKSAPLLGAPPSDPTPTKDEVMREARRVFANPEKASHWLQRPSQALGGRTPSAMLESEAELREVVEELGRIDHGMLS